MDVAISVNTVLLALVSSVMNLQWTGDLNLVRIETRAVHSAPITRHTLLNCALEIANSASIGDFVAVEIHHNPNKAYMICLVEGLPRLEDGDQVMEGKELLPVTPGSLLFALSEMSCNFKVQDIIAGKVEPTVTSNESRTRSRTIITRDRLEHDDLD